jgi:ferredoxin, 2Fe-2S
MAEITYVEFDGVERRLDLKTGVNLMQAAVANSVRGIDGDCGGACACATCHVHVDPKWLDRLGPRNRAEAEMLEFAEGVQDDSRLACQIVVQDDLDGLIVRLPQAQH